MKICTMTCHHVYNYGATLQAYALQHYLESLGHEVEIIDYRLPSHRRYDWSYLYPEGRLYKLTLKLPFIKWIVCLYRNRIYIKTWGRKRKFDMFDSCYLNITDFIYRTIDELKCNPPFADIYIAGSDQIWNPEYENGTNFGYYLDFGDDRTKRISYAASFGVSQISDEQKLFVKSMLKKFAFLSVREQSGISILSAIGLKASQTMDPVFLLSKEEWVKGMNLSLDVKDYIMVYDFNHDNKKMFDFVEELAKSENLKVLSVNDTDDSPCADIQINNAGPKEFLQYLVNAKYVVGNSFHATAFSLIFNKKFASFPLIALSNSSRITDMLKSLKLEDHYMPCDINVIKQNVDWESINGMIESQIMSSKEFLINALSHK